MGCEMKHCRVPASRNERIILLCQPLNFKNFSTPEAPFQGSSIQRMRMQPRPDVTLSCSC